MNPNDRTIVPITHGATVWRRIAEVFLPDRPIAIRCPAGDLAEMRSFALTAPDRQYGVDSDGAIFAASRRGKTRAGERHYIDRVSPLIDEVALEFNRHRRGRGGRFYEVAGRIVDADTHECILVIECA